MEIKKSVWVIMDKKKKIIAKGIPRHRYLERVDNEDDKKRIITYSSKGMAEAGFKTSWFYTGDGLGNYFKDAYGSYYDYEEKKKFGPEKEDCMEAVEAELILKI